MSGLSEQLALRFLGGHPSQAAHALEDLGPTEAGEVLSSVEPRIAALVLREMAAPEIRRCLDQMDTDRSSSILAEFPAGTAVSVLASLEREARDSLIAGLPASVRQDIRHRLEFPAATVGRLMEPAPNVIGEDFSPDSARDILQKTGAVYLYIVDRQQRLTAVLSRRDLEDPRKRPPSDLIVRNPVSLSATLALESARGHAAWREFDVLPVVDRSRSLVGTLRHKQLRRTAGGPRLTALVPGAGLDTLVSLGEAYCSGLWEVIGSMAQANKDRTPSGAPELGGKK